MWGWTFRCFRFSIRCPSNLPTRWWARPTTRTQQHLIFPSSNPKPGQLWQGGVGHADEMCGVRRGDNRSHCPPYWSTALWSVAQGETNHRRHQTWYSIGGEPLSVLHQDCCRTRSSCAGSRQAHYGRSSIPRSIEKGVKGHGAVTREKGGRCELPDSPNEDADENARHHSRSNQLLKR